MNKKLLLLILPILLVVSGVFLFNPTKDSSTPPPTTIERTQLVTTIINDGTTQEVYTNDFQPDQTALALLKNLNVPITEKVYPFGTLVESINSLANTPEKSWIYFVNDASAAVGADTYILKPGDTIEWKYIKPAF